MTDEPRDDVVVELERKLRKAELRVEKAELAAKTRDKEREPIYLDYPATQIRLVWDARGRRKACGKEPFTVAWIERSLGQGDVFYDIGANIGAYSLVAAAASGGAARVFSFEPGYATFPVLCENVLVNDFSGTITPLPVALGSKTELGTFFYRSYKPGSAGHYSKESGDPQFESLYDQPVLKFRLDDLLGQFGLPAPTHVKLDVDGGEREVLSGAEEMLKGNSLKAVLVELGEGDEDVRPLLTGAGFELVDTFEHPRVWYGLFER